MQTLGYAGLQLGLDSATKLSEPITNNTVKTTIAPALSIFLIQKNSKYAQV